ncbi:hypothetical protein [Chamaesiphon polymorphus]|uniref:DUF7822 domain-containing protein n=1 Tax=Chamaesiphon polymorphus CCALA 037 TaxID=2107692 RepID=A0A2T1GCC1_9CYAN|nr:hypothetical protein [Chamaesiphon polymorphus]PSB55037.1 hypothetical protein C7B77_16315 [Chamaesiphon polymorphus CCALA 037]
MCDSVEFRDIAEWKSFIPVAHLILVGENPTPCQSAIWTVEEKIAIEGDANITRPLFLKLLDWLEPQVDEGFANAAREAREYLMRADRQGDKFHLELGEIYELEGLDLPEMATETISNAALAKEIFLDVKRVLERDGSTIDSFEHVSLRAITNWEEQFGCYFSHVLYFHLGG